MTFVCQLLLLSLSLCSVVSAQELHTTTRNLQNGWTKPSWWRAYRLKFRRRRLKKCLFLLGEVPQTGMACPMRGNSEWYMCMYGEQTCPATTGSLEIIGNYTGDGLGELHPTNVCICKNDTLQFECTTWNPCELLVAPGEGTEPPEQSESYDSCPNNEPIGSEGVCSADLRCTYGNETCCGQTFDSLVCRCGQGERFACYFTDACYFPPCQTDQTQPVLVAPVETEFTVCPPEAPIGEQVKCGDSDLLCAYGTETCCGKTHDSIVCDCAAGEIFECLYTDACQEPSCPDIVGTIDAADKVEGGGASLAPPMDVSCPEDRPAGDSSFICGSTELECGYGTESCCGNTYDSLVCRCQPGEPLRCFFSEACLIPTCGTTPTLPARTNIMTCPSEAPYGTAICGAEALTCLYGDLVCRCDANSQFTCLL